MDKILYFHEIKDKNEAGEVTGGFLIPIYDPGDQETNDLIKMLEEKVEEERNRGRGE